MKNKKLLVFLTAFVMLCSVSAYATDPQYPPVNGEEMHDFNPIGWLWDLIKKIGPHECGQCPHPRSS